MGNNSMLGVFVMVRLVMAMPSVLVSYYVISVSLMVMPVGLSSRGPLMGTMFWSCSLPLMCTKRSFGSVIVILSAHLGLALITGNVVLHCTGARFYRIGMTCV